MIYSHLIYINSTNSNGVGLSKKLSKFATTPISELRQNIIFHKYMLTIQKIRDSKEGE